jgi:succinyl-CoA synthetase beta subunit
MGKQFLVIVLFLSLATAFSWGSRASAQDYNHTITVYATVPEQRAIYLDANGNIIKVAGNTTRNITPQVFSADNQLIDMNDLIMSQYQVFINQHHNHLAAGKIYEVNPLAVNTQPNQVIINVDANLQARLSSLAPKKLSF